MTTIILRPNHRRRRASRPRTTRGIRVNVPTTHTDDEREKQREFYHGASALMMNASHAVKTNTSTQLYASPPPPPLSVGSYMRGPTTTLRTAGISTSNISSSPSSCRRTARRVSVVSSSVKTCRAARRVRRFAMPPTTPDDAADADVETIARMVSWAAARGASGSGLTVALDTTGGGGRGLEATRDVMRGQVVLATPLTVGIVDDEKGHPESAREVMRDAPWGVRLACRLLQEKKKGEESEYAAYAATLPNRVDTSPIHYDDAAIADVQYPPAMSEIKEMQAACRKWHETLREKAPEALGAAYFDYEAFANAVGVVHSRTYGVASAEDNAGYFRALLPLADMLNHGGDIVTGLTRDEKTGEVTDMTIEATDNVAWSTLGDDGVIQFAATRDIAEGEEALMSYGERSNDHFLIYYGFAPSNNPHDDVVLFSNFEHAMVWHSVAHPELWEGPEAGVREKAANDAFERVTKALEADGSADAALAASEPRLKTLSAGRVDARLLSAYAAMYAGTEASGDVDGPICGDELKFARADIAARCEQLLSQMPTTFEDDLARLQSGDVGSDSERVRLIYRACKKKMLKETAETFKLSA